MPEPFRIAPKMPPSAYKTYALRMPPATHFRKATCQEVDCRAYVNGWVTHIDVSTELGQRQARYIVDKSGRTYTTNGTPDSTDTRVTFTFPPGQQCFADHQVPLEREPFYIVRDGDWRGNPTGRKMRHANAQDWIDDFGEHQQNIAESKERG